MLCITQIRLGMVDYDGWVADREGLDGLLEGLKHNTTLRTLKWVIGLFLVITFHLRFNGQNSV